MKVLLTAWAAKRYDPPPSLWVLRRWVRDGEIYPPAELVGRTYYVDENARRMTETDAAGTPTGTLVDRLRAANG